MKPLALLLLLHLPLLAHDASGRSSAPIESRRLVNPVRASESVFYNAAANYAKLCVDCHGADGKSKTRQAGKLPNRPTDLTNYFMQGMKDGEIYWIISNGDPKGMPGFTAQLAETQRWELVAWVRELRIRQLYAERLQLGSYEWDLPPGFPHPKVPYTNLMTPEKVELGRYLFYDKRLSQNQKQSCGSCHQQSKAFTDARLQAEGSTGEIHPRGAMSLINVAYSPVLGWANPNLKSLEQQILVPLFGTHPVELGMSGKEDLLVQRLKEEPKYPKMFASAFPETPDSITLANAVNAIASFERTLLSGDSPYDEYRRGDDPDAISPSAKRGESLFFSERLECFHCHGGFNLTGTVDYLGKATPELEFHNTGLFDLKNESSYPADNPGLFEFTRKPEDGGKFKAPTLRNIALTSPYMHDGSVKTLEEAVEHYASGGRAAANKNKSEFVKPFALTAQEKEDLVNFLKSLTDPQIASNAKWSDPWSPPLQTKPPPPSHVLRGVVREVFPDAGSVLVSHAAVENFLDAAAKPREFLVRDKSLLANLKPGVRITAGVKKRGSDYVLEQIKPYRQ